MTRFRVSSSAAPLIAAVVVTTAVFASPAEAKITKELKEEVIGFIQKGVESKDPLTRSYAILAAGPLKDRDLDKVIVPYLENTNRALRHAAIISLASRNDRKGVAALEKEIADAKGSRVAVMTRLMPELPEKVQLKVLKGLIKGRKVDPKVQGDALRYISEYGQGKVYDLLGDVARARKAQDAAPYLKVLMANPRPEAFGWVEKMAKSRDAAIRKEAFKLARRIGGSQVDPLARTMLGDKDEAVAREAADYLREKGDPSAADFLIKALAKAPASEHRELAEVIIDEGYRVPLDLATKLIESETSDEDLQRLYYKLYGATQETEALERLIKLERSTRIEERKLAVTGLPHTRSKTAFDVVLKRTAFDGNHEVRLITIEGLGYMGLEEAVPTLKDVLLKFGDKQFQYAAIASLGRIKSPKAAEQLKYKALTPDLKMKKLVFDGLERLKQPNTVDIIDRLTTDNDAELRWRATLLLIQLNQAKGMTRLDYALQRPPQDYIYSVVDLPEAARSAVLSHMLRHEKELVRNEALSGVSLIGYEGVKFMREIAYKDALVTEDAKRTYAPELFEAAFSELLRRDSDEDLNFFMRIAQTGSEDRKIQALAWLTRRASEAMVPRFRTLMKGSKSNKAMHLAAINGLLRSES